MQRFLCPGVRRSFVCLHAWLFAIVADAMREVCMRRVVCFLLLLLMGVVGTGHALASVFGQVEGVVHDPHHRPVAGAQITVRAGRSDLSYTAVSGADGTFRVSALPL